MSVSFVVEAVVVVVVVESTVVVVDWIELCVLVVI